MSVFKKVTAALSTLVVAVLVTLFCVVFTAPGNQLIAYSANKLVDGLKIEIKNWRFLYNDAFNLRFERDGLLLDAQQLKLDLFWWHCDGMCIDNLSARSIKLNLPASSSNSPDTSSEPLE
jgi:translocation and assembly module TamB